jgi:photosystem II stability/assembly factor-like uncharacterized protein
MSQNPVFGALQTLLVQIDGATTTLLRMHRLAFFVAFLFAGLSSTHAQWQIQTVPTTADLRGIHALGNGIAWASGTEGTVLRTTDNGAHWQRCATPPGAEPLDFRGIQALDASTAIVMSSGKGPLSRLYKTTDACQTWKLVLIDPDKDGFWDSIRATFSEDRKSIDATIAGDPVQGSFTLFNLNIPLGTQESHIVSLPNDLCKLQQSRQLPLPIDPCLRSLFDRQSLAEAPHLEGGAAQAERGRVTLMKAYANPAPLNAETLFAASNSSIANHSDTWFSPDIAFVTGGPSGARFLHYRGWPCAGMGCINWRVTNVPLATGDSAGAFSIFVKANRKGSWGGVIVGGDYSKPDSGINSCAFSKDEGKTWKPSVAMPHGYRSAIAYDAATNTWITVGPNGTDISTDDGSHWRAIHPAPNEPPYADQHWNALSLPFVVGPHGRIGKLNPKVLAYDVGRTAAESGFSLSRERNP